MMKNILSAFLIIFLYGFTLASPAIETPNAKPDIFGYYIFEGKVPKAFADISHIHLAGYSGEQQTPQSFGFIRLKKKNAKDLDLLGITLKGKNVSFITYTVGGIHYYFNGTFTKLGDFPANPPQGIVLKGKLFKLKNNRKFAEANVRFRYEAGD